MKIQFFSLCDVDTLKEDTKNMDRLEDYLLSVALEHEDPKDWFFEAMQQFKDMRLIIENLINDAEKSQSDDQTDNCLLCREKDLHINDLKAINKDQSEIIKEKQRQIEALEKLSDLQKPVDNIKEGYADKRDDTQSHTQKEHELRQEIKQLKQWVKELLPDELKNQSEPKK